MKTPTAKMPADCYPDYWIDKFNTSPYFGGLTDREKQVWSLRMATWNSLSPLGSNRSQSFISSQIALKDTYNAEQASKHWSNSGLGTAGEE